MDLINSEKQWKEIQDQAAAALAKIDVLKSEQKQADRALSRTVNFLDKEVGDVVEREPFLEFFKTPYAIIPFGKNKGLVAVPKFVKNFQVGWLWKETESFYIYQFDQYSAWLSDAPVALMEAINFKHGLAIQIEGNVITFDEGGKKDVKEKLKDDLTEIGDNSARIKRGHVFDVIATAVENGCLPFKPRKVAADDLRPQCSKIKLRPYQKEAVDKFMDTGAVAGQPLVHRGPCRETRAGENDPDADVGKGCSRRLNRERRDGGRPCAAPGEPRGPDNSGTSH